MKEALTGLSVHITGVVQGVGFRPFVYHFARRLDIRGWVKNTSAGVDILGDGSKENLDSFIATLRDEAPPLARIDQILFEWVEPGGFQEFSIESSQPIAGAFQPISADVSICPDCLQEILDPGNRRYLYPFTNCTNCGPRFTIITDIPYDRPNTTMADFPMCPQCSAEYHNPDDRRFHAQPIACPVCGPNVWLEAGDEIIHGTAAIGRLQALLLDGKIVAIKGLGGFHLACDALNSNAVRTLRQRKLRVDKPFAVMAPNLGTIREHCLVNLAESELLQSFEHPIVLLERLPTSSISLQVAPGQNTLGMMLPYTPLHHLLFSAQVGGIRPAQILVMTSGNLSEEPIAHDNDQARQNLSSLADAFLMHNRPIRTRCDDSVVRLAPPPAASDLYSNYSEKHIKEPGRLFPLRRSRGYAPFPVHLPFASLPVLAAGAELKNTFCLAQQEYAFLSHHIGDLQNYETLCSFEDGIQHFERLFRFTPQVLAHDLHPDYLASRYALQRAQEQGIITTGVQHHHAHIAACMAENLLGPDSQVIGVSFDGTGYGEDGAIWGGEFLLAGYASYQRLAHLAYLPLPGGDKAIREPWRVALAWLAQAGNDWSDHLPSIQYVHHSVEDPDQILTVLKQQLKSKLNTPLTSSMGRLFDAAAALAGVRQVVNYEAQAAIEFENVLDPSEPSAYSFEIRSAPAALDLLPWYNRMEIDPTPALLSLLEDLENRVALPIISARFHNAVAQVVLKTCQILRELTGINQIALSGGVWQNMQLFRKTNLLLDEAHFEVLTHHQVPTNDGGVSLGQAVVASRRFN